MILVSRICAVAFCGASLLSVVSKSELEEMRPFVDLEELWGPTICKVFDANS